ncbi:MAG: STAS domain-containing protein [Vicinamibacterales bacterium]
MSASSFALEIFVGRRTRVVAACGSLVVGAGAGAPEWAAVAAPGRANAVVLDLSAVSAIDAGGVGRLLLIRSQLARRGAQLSVAAATPRVWRVVELLRLDRVLAPLGHPHLAEPPAVDATSTAGRLPRCA